MTEDTEVVKLFIQSLLEILQYGLKEGIPGIWMLFEKAKIPTDLVRYSADLRYCRRCVFFLLNTHVLSISPIHIEMSFISLEIDSNGA